MYLFFELLKLLKKNKNRLNYNFINLLRNLSNIKLVSISEIKRKLADYCVYQDRSHWEVEQKMKSYGYLNEEERGEIIIWLIQNNFLNEERFACSYARGKFYQKNWGKIKIKMGLKQKKIPEKLVEKGLQEIKEEDYLEVLNLLAKKKWEILPREASVFNKRKKLSMYLSQKGYESFLVYEVINTFYEN